MPDERSLELYLRGRIWWIRGNRPDNDRYIRESLGTPDETVAQAKLEEIYREARKRRVLGPDAPKLEDLLTFDDCVLLYDAKLKEAQYLIPIKKQIGSLKIREITPQSVRQLAKKMFPYDATDTWRRKVVVPISAVINNAHELGRCPPIRIKAYKEDARIDQDRKRGKKSREPRTPGSWPWVLAFCAAAEPRDAALCWFMFSTGARVGQSIAMDRRSDMDLGAAKLRLPPTKGFEATWVEIDPELVVMISNLPRPYRGAARHRVFTIAGGRSGALYRRWQATCERAGIEYIPPHAAGRHGFGTEMIVRQRVDPVSAATEGRWKSAAVMLKTYAHPEGSKEIVRAAFRAGLDAARTSGVQNAEDGGPKREKTNDKSTA